MASGVKNGNKESPTEFGDKYLKIVVVGEPRCGKTTFIRACVRHGTAQPETFVTGAKVYPCEFELVGGEATLVALYEIPSEPTCSLVERQPHYEKANILVYMYAIDDPSSFEMVSSKWFPETIPYLNLRFDPVALVGNKLDLRNNQQVIERLALSNQVPVTPEQTVGFFGPDVPRSLTKEVSSNNPGDIYRLFTDICNLHYTALS